ncbi:hypothetical protein KKG83_05395 [Candidatus Micrarchaeota archaeon]|nr:hypothetical protein [Candidatus Micrarchaeota archaeon]
MGKPVRRNYPRKTYTDKLYRRFSQITGVPVRKLIPEKKAFFRHDVGFYYPNTHEIETSRKKNRYTENHEMRHALQALSNPVVAGLYKKSNVTKDIKAIAKLKKITNFHRKWAEATNTDPDKSAFTEAFSDMGSIKNSSVALPFFFLYKPLALAYAYYLPQYISQIKRHTNVRKIYKNHGEDGVLLLWVAPPKKLDALEIPKWEKQMVKKGYLKEKGGMAKKGLQYFRRKLQSATIWQRLKEMEERRIAK